MFKEDECVLCENNQRATQAVNKLETLKQWTKDYLCEIIDFAENYNDLVRELDKLDISIDSIIK